MKQADRTRLTVPGICVAALILCAIAANAFGREAIEWKETKGKMFIVYTMKGAITPAKKIIDAAEKSVDRVFKETGVRKPSGYWSWENRVKLHVYHKRYQYITGVHAPGWTGGKLKYEARGKIKEMATYDVEKRMLESYIPHIVAHMVLCDVNQGKGTSRGKIPFWLAEGIAQQMENAMWGKERESFRFLLKDEKSLQTFTLNSMRSPPYAHIEEFSTIRLSPGGGHLMKTSNSTQTFYYKTMSVVAFMQKKYGTSKFKAFIKTLREEGNMADALKKLRGKATTVEDLEKAWREYVVKLKDTSY